MVAESVIEQQRREFGNSPAASQIVQASGNYQPYLQAGLTIPLTLVGNIIIGQPIIFNPNIGMRLHLVMTQDGTGSRTVAFSSCWRDIPAGWASGGSAGQVASGEFLFDGFSWQFVGGSSAFASPGVSINVGTGIVQLSLVPSAPVVYGSVQIAPPVSTTTAAGVAPGFVRGTVIAPTVGAASIPGVAASIAFNMSTPTGSMVTAGQSALRTP
jgi:hypothetical protein